jgi:hypothetical protein
MHKNISSIQLRTLGGKDIKVVIVRDTFGLFACAES